MSLLVVAWLVAGAVLSARRPSEPLGVVLLTMTTGAAIGMVSTSASGPLAELVTRMVAGAAPLRGPPRARGAARRQLHVPRQPQRRVGGLATGALVGLLLWAARPSLPWWPIVLEVMVAALVGFPLANARYRRAAVRERQRMQWFGCRARHRRRGRGRRHRHARARQLARARRPHDRGRHTSPARRARRHRVGRWVGHADRVLTYCVSLAGLSGVVVAVYLVIVLGLGRTPTPTSARCWSCRWWPRVSPPRSACRRASGWSASPTGSSTASGTRPTRCCARSAAASRVRSRWTSCCSSWSSRSARRWRSSRRGVDRVQRAPGAHRVGARARARRTCR